MLGKRGREGKKRKVSGPVGQREENWVKERGKGSIDRKRAIAERGEGKLEGGMPNPGTPDF